VTLQPSPRTNAPAIIAGVFLARHMTAPTPTFVQAPAKLNLILSVAVPEPIGAEKAGFHRIASWFAAVSVRDDVEISPADGGSTFEVAWAADAPRPTPIDWPADKDLAFRAARCPPASASANASP
jgi:4-diphosphocytidyl-2C-methyl-D-erythritol kinase